MKRIITQSVLTALMLSSAILADEVELSDVEARYSNKSSVNAGDKLEQSIDFGFSNTTGNTDTLNLNGKYNMSFTTVGYGNEKLKVGFDTSVYINKNDNVKSNEEYKANLGLEQYITNDGWLGYAAVNWLRNPEFKNLNNKFSIGAGVGREIFNNGWDSLKLKLGLAYNIQEYADANADAKFTSLNEYLEYNNKLNETSTFFAKIGASENLKDFKNDYELLASGGLHFSVAKNIYVTIEEEMLYDKIHPGTQSATDTKSIIRVGYNF